MFLLVLQGWSQISIWLTSGICCCLTGGVYTACTYFTVTVWPPSNSDKIKTGNTGSERELRHVTKVPAYNWVMHLNHQATGTPLHTYFSISWVYLTLISSFFTHRKNKAMNASCLQYITFYLHLKQKIIIKNFHVASRSLQLSRFLINSSVGDIQNWSFSSGFTATVQRQSRESNLDNMWNPDKVNHNTGPHAVLCPVCLQHKEM